MTHEEMMKFRKNYVEKRNFHSTKEPTNINDVNIDNILVSNKNHVRKKHLSVFWLCKSSNDSMKSLLIKLPKLNGPIKLLEKVKHAYCG